MVMKKYMRKNAQVLPLILLSIFLAACGDSHDKPPTSPPVVTPDPLPEYDFTLVDERLQQFLDESEAFDGISVTLVDQTQGVVHEAAFGDHTLDIVVMLASASKVPTASLLMALNDDDSLNYNIEASIDNYLPWEGVYGDRSTVQLLSNTAGIPGIAAVFSYGVHMCQFEADVQLADCAQILYANELPDSQPPATGFSYGGTQWQLAAAVAEQVTNSLFNQAFDQYIAKPCGLEVFTYGNPWSDIESWNGSPDSLIGQSNAQAEGGAISNMSDYAKILLMHLNGGKCGDTQVIAESSVEFMQLDRAGEFGAAYGMGWFILTPEEGGAPTVFYDPGFFGSISWLDIERNIGGYVAVDRYTITGSAETYGLVLNDIIPLVAQAVDEARAAVEK